MIIKRFNLEIDLGCDNFDIAVINESIEGLNQSALIGLMLHSVQQGAIQSVKYRGFKIFAMHMADTCGNPISDNTEICVVIPYKDLGRITLG
jgi:hypothetical protein